MLAAAVVVAACPGSENGGAGAKSDAASADSSGIRALQGGRRDARRLCLSGERAVGAVRVLPARACWIGAAPGLDRKGRREIDRGGRDEFRREYRQAPRLEVFLYPDSAARIADALRLDRKQLVGATQEQTIKRERTLIENANLSGC